MTSKTRNLIATAAALPLLVGLSGCGASGLSQAAQMIDQARKVQKTAKTVEQVTGQDMGLIADPLNMDGRAEAMAAESAAELANAAPISSAPMAVTEMRKTSGKTKALSLRPKIAVAGYNVAAYTEGQVVGEAGTNGFLNRRNLGARSTMILQTTGIDDALLTRVADAASADLVAQLTAAGFDVVAPATVARAENFGAVKAGKAAQSKKLVSHDGEKMGAIVVGPSGFGYRTVSSGLQETGFAASMAHGGNAPGKLSHELDAVLVYPTVLLDFASLEGSRSLGSFARASAEADLGFALSRQSSMGVAASKDGRYVNSSATYGVKKPVTSDAVFASWGAKSERENTLERGLGSLMGTQTMAKKTTTQVVNVDPSRYEALALSAARGWNAAFVAQVVA
ncbi:MAG: hypothetical protein WBF53_16040, partial [Litorimonas sp.]